MSDKRTDEEIMNDKTEHPDVREAARQRVIAKSAKAAPADH